MDMKKFSEFTPNKFLVVLGKMQSTVFGKVEKHLKDLGFNTSEFLIMYAIAAHGPLTIQDIAARISVTSGNMTYTVNKLENRGIVKRVSCPEDKRMTYIDFTDSGRDTWKQGLEDHSQFLEEAFKDIDEATMIQTIELMKIIGKKFI